jgi:crotonobetainyl-CoA:carnitine CoA-transferase CaiB-like acyl-CoA transferase
VNPGRDFQPLTGLTVVEMAGGIPAAYCGKLFADAGATVVRVEDPDRDTLRRWSWSGSVGRDGRDDGALYRHLSEGKDVVRLAGDGSAERERRSGRLLEFCDGADLLIEEGLTSPFGQGAAIRGTESRNAALTVVSISPYGRTGPLGGHAASEFLLQARMGSVYTHGLPGRIPIQVGGRLGEWASGLFAAVGGLAGCLHAARTGAGVDLDVSMLECLSLSLVTYPTLRAALPGGSRSRAVGVMLPAVEPCADGYVGLFTVTAEQFCSFLAMIERSDLAADEDLMTFEGRVARLDELVGAIHAWTTVRTVDEVIEQAVLFRVPVSPIGTGESLPELEQVASRGVFSRSEALGVLRPRTPFRWHLPAGDTNDAAARRPSGSAGWDGDPTEDFTPLAGVRVLDLTAFWAGPFATTFLGSMGADILKVESIQRPDPMRYNSGAPPTEPQWYEQGFLYQPVNLGKKSITLNLQDPVGRELALRLARTCDVTIENFTPRVLEHFDLTFDVLRQAQPDMVLVRMPAFGLDGPWRDRPGFATTIEQASGMAWVTGYRDGPPMMPGGSCDPLAGMFAAFAVMGALRHRSRGGGAQMIELPMIELGAALAAEQVLEWDAYGSLIERDANRDPRAAPQGVYACVGHEAWVALSVTTDAAWSGLAQLIGLPNPQDGALVTASGRHSHHDELDELLARWCAVRPLTDALAALEGAGVPCAAVGAAYDIDQDPQMRARGFWQEVEHPIVGRHLFPTWPMRTASRRAPWHGGPAPLLGQHTEQILSDDLGIGPAELERLRDGQVIGTAPAYG